MESIALGLVDSLIYEIGFAIITALAAFLTIYLKNLIYTNKTIAEYNFNNERTEIIMADAIKYAENTAKRNLAKSTEIMESSDKKRLAIDYILKVAPDVYSENIDTLSIMVDRKVAEVFPK